MSDKRKIQEPPYMIFYEIVHIKDADKNCEDAGENCKDTGKNTGIRLRL